MLQGSDPMDADLDVEIPLDLLNLEGNWCHQGDIISFF